MTRHTYRLEPLVRLSERGVAVARRQVVAATREVQRRVDAVRATQEVHASAVDGARQAAQSTDLDATKVRIIAESRVEALFDTALTAARNVERAGRSLGRATSERNRRLGEARVAERDAELQQAARTRALERIRARVRRRAERLESDLALELWIASSLNDEMEDEHAS